MNEDTIEHNYWFGEDEAKEVQMKQYKRCLKCDESVVVEKSKKDCPKCKKKNCLLG